ncbi:MAG: hypothetical protein LBB08_01870 [Rickettsiales bacterium]|jgi:hypothetical protein|nr:hypothetical protein [Rickettsiales bacterium]
MAHTQHLKLFNITEDNTICNLMLKPTVQEPDLICAFRDSGFGSYTKSMFIAVPFYSCIKRDTVESNALSDDVNFHTCVSYKIFLDDKPCGNCSNSKARSVDSVGELGCNAATKVECLVDESIRAKDVSILHDFCHHDGLCRLIKNVAPLCIAR